MAHERQGGGKASSRKNTRDKHESGPQKGRKEEKRDQKGWTQREGHKPKGEPGKRNSKKK